MNCKHNDGWIIDSDIVIVPYNTYFMNDDIEIMTRCNHTGCNMQRKFKIDIRNIEELKIK